MGKKLASNIMRRGKRYTEQRGIIWRNLANYSVKLQQGKHMLRRGGRFYPSVKKP